MPSHEKHSKLTKPGNGHFHRCEWAIMGTTCGEIQRLAKVLVRSAKDKLVAYIDADHKGENPSEASPSTALDGIWMAYTDKISFGQFTYASQPQPMAMRRYFDQADMVIVNGNHFEAEKQILVLDPRKPLEKKLDKIVRPVLVIITDALSEIPLAVAEKFPSISELPKIHLTDEVALQKWIAAQCPAPDIKGLILAGGKSTRMQQDKALLDYHGMTQIAYLQQIMAGLDLQTHISVRHDQALPVKNAIADSFIGLGPYGAILSAFREDPQAAWLVVACDLPMLSESTLRQLVSARDASKLATAFYNEATGFPDPLITIWEPKAYPMMLHFLSQGYSCPRKVLINSNIKVIQPSHPSEIMNANTPTDYQEAKKLLRKRFMRP